MISPGPNPRPHNKSLMGTLRRQECLRRVARNAHLLHFDHADAFPLEIWPIVREVNRLIQAHTGTDKRLHFIDLTDTILAPMASRTATCFVLTGCIQ